MARVAPQLYQEVTQCFRSSIISELATGRYSHVRNPNNKSRGPGSVVDTRYRFSILARPNLPQTGARHLTIGSSEILLVLQGVVPHSADWRAGLAFDSKRAHYRFVFGVKSACHDLAESVRDDFEAHFGKGKFQLSRGHYHQFVRSTLELMDDQLDIFKSFLHEDSYSLPHVAPVSCSVARPSLNRRVL